MRVQGALVAVSGVSQLGSSSEMGNPASKIDLEVRHAVPALQILLQLHCLYNMKSCLGARHKLVFTARTDACARLQCGINTPRNLFPWARH